MKTYAFIDSQNLNLGVRSQGWKLDFERFRVFLKDKYKVEKELGEQYENEKRLKEQEIKAEKDLLNLLRA